MDIYELFKRWFRINYGHLGYDLTPCYITEDLVTKFDVLRFGRETEIKELNLEKIMDFSVGDGELRKLLFDALFRCSFAKFKVSKFLLILSCVDFFIMYVSCIVL